MWHHIQYACYHNCLGHYTPMCITSEPVYWWHHIQYVCYHHTAFMKTQRLYRTSHPPYLTSQALYLCHHTDGTDIFIDVSLYWWHQNKCVRHHTWHTYDIIPNLHPITFTLYDMNDHILWHHIQGIHDDLSHHLLFPVTGSANSQTRPLVSAFHFYPCSSPGSWAAPVVWTPSLRLKWCDEGQYASLCQ